MIYPIVIYGDDVLRKACEPVPADYPDLKKLIGDMFATLGEAGGVGLAAPQIGKSLQLFIVDCTPWAEDDASCADFKRAFVNAEIYAYSDQTMHLCVLSGAYGNKLGVRHPIRSGHKGC